MSEASNGAYLLGKRRTLIVFAGLLLGMLLAAVTVMGAMLTTNLHDLHAVFALGVPLMLAALAATVFVERRELRRTVREEPGDPGRELFDEPRPHVARRPGASRRAPGRAQRRTRPHRAGGRSAHRHGGRRRPRPLTLPL